MDEETEAQHVSAPESHSGWAGIHTYVFRFKSQFFLSFFFFLQNWVKFIFISFISGWVPTTAQASFISSCCLPISCSWGFWMFSVFLKSRPHPHQINLPSFQLPGGERIIKGLPVGIGTTEELSIHCWKTAPGQTLRAGRNLAPPTSAYYLLPVPPVGSTSPDSAEHSRGHISSRMTLHQSFSAHISSF